MGCTLKSNCQGADYGTEDLARVSTVIEEVRLVFNVQRRGSLNTWRWTVKGSLEDTPVGDVNDGVVKNNPVSSTPTRPSDRS